MKGTITLSSCLDSHAAEALAVALSERRGHALTLDAGGVTFVGALAAQLLVSAFRQWGEDGKSLVVESVSDDFVGGLVLLGIPLATLGLSNAGEDKP